jgi:Ni/Co efflux regulator RcnB
VSRQFERDRSREVVQPGPSERGWDGRRDGHQVGPAFDARNGRDGRWDDRNGDRRGDGRGGDRHWGRGDHWQSGRYPPVFWAQDRFRVGPYRQPYGYYVRSWAFGDFLPRGWFAEPYWIGDFLDYDLPYPPPGFEWVRVGGDALLVDRYNGRIVQIVRGIFW